MSPSHSIRVAEKTGPLYTVDLERAASADRDFVLSWEPVAGLAAQAALYTQERDGERYVLLMVIPPAGAPGLSGVTVQWDDKEAETWPRSLPDLQPGRALVVAARLSPEASLAVISGRRGSAPWQVVLPLGSAAPGQAIDKLWARLKVEALSSGPRDERAAAEARPTVTDLGLRYGLVTEHTSLVAEDAEAAAANALPLRAWVPLAEPVLVADAGGTGGTGVAKSLVLAPTSGASAAGPPIPPDQPWKRLRSDLGRLLAAPRSGGVWKLGTGKLGTGGTAAMADCTGVAGTIVREPRSRCFPPLRSPSRRSRGSGAAPRCSESLRHSGHFAPVHLLQTSGSDDPTLAGASAPQAVQGDRTTPALFSRRRP